MSYAYNKNTLFIPPFSIRFANAEVFYGRNSTYLHPLGGTEVEHTIGRKNVVIRGDFELMYVPTESITPRVPDEVRNTSNNIVIRFLNIWKTLSLPAFYFSNTLFTRVKVHDYRIVNTSDKPRRPRIEVQLREMPTSLNKTGLLDGLYIGTPFLASEFGNRILQQTREVI